MKRQIPPKTMREKKGFVLSPGMLGHIAALLRPHFAPASLFQPPGSTLENRGNRQTAITTSNNNPPVDQTNMFLSNGVGLWNFATKFNVAPIIQVTAIGPPITQAHATLFLSAPPTPNAVLVRSTDNTDGREIHITAQGNPN